MAAILFRPSDECDRREWIPVLRRVFTDRDFRICPEETGNAADIHYLIGWTPMPGDRTGWPNLKAFLSLSAGVNQYVGNPEMPDAALVRMIEPGLENAMAEYVAGYVLRFHREQDDMERAVERGQWPRLIPLPASRRTVGIMGMGRMGMACVDVLKPFGFGLRGWSRTERAVDGVSCFSGTAGLDEFLRGTDILVCLLPLTPDTENILNRTTLQTLPPGSFLINAARGKHLVEEDLAALVRSRHIRAAALDVFRREPLPIGHPFRDLPQIRMTPHIAAVTVPETGARSLRTAIETLDRGERPDGLVETGRDY